MPAQKPLSYLMKELAFKANEWSALDEKDKAELKQWAADEMRVRGIEVAE